MIFSGKTLLMIILKVTKKKKKNKSFTLCLENKIFGKSTGNQTGSQAFLGLIKDSRSAHIIDGVLSDFWY